MSILLQYGTRPHDGMMGNFFTHVQMCKPVAGFVTENLKRNVRARVLLWEECLTVREIPLVARLLRHAGRRENSARGKISWPIW